MSKIIARASLRFGAIRTYRVWFWYTVTVAVRSHRFLPATNEQVVSRHFKKSNAMACHQDCMNELWSDDDSENGRSLIPEELP